jgi:hypothetical protein
MSVYLDLRNGYPACDLSCATSAFNGPVLGPFLGVHLTQDEVRVATTTKEVPLQRAGAWIFYGGGAYADAEIVAEDQIGSRRKRRLTVFDPLLSHLAIEELG